jgi:hypothetical protein
VAELTPKDVRDMISEKLEAHHEIDAAQGQLMESRMDALTEIIKKISSDFDVFKREIIATNKKYLDGFNRVLETIAEEKSKLRKLENRYIAYKEKMISVYEFIEDIKKQNMTDTVKEHDFYIKQMKSFDFITFINESKNKFKFLVAAVYLFSASILTLLTAMIVEFLKG